MESNLNAVLLQSSNLSTCRTGVYAKFGPVSSNAYKIACTFCANYFVSTSVNQDVPFEIKEVIFFHEPSEVAADIFGREVGPQFLWQNGFLCPFRFTSQACSWYIFIEHYCSCDQRKDFDIETLQKKTMRLAASIHKFESVISNLMSELRLSSE